MGLFSIAISFLVSVFSSLITCRFFILFSASKNRPLYYVFYVLINILVNAIFLSPQVHIPPMLAQAISCLITFAFCSIVLKANLGIAALMSILNAVVFGIYNALAFALSGILYRETQIHGYWIEAMSSLVILVLSAITFEVLMQRYGKQKNQGGKYSILYICPLTFIYLVTETLINIAYNPVVAEKGRLYYNTDTSQDMGILFVIGLALISIYVILYFYERAVMQIEAQNKMVALEVYTQMQKQYINEAKQKYESTQAFRHDAHNHMVTLAGLVQSNETDKAREYLKQFETQVKNLSFEVFTGNAVIDVLFKEKLGFAKEQGIRVLCDAAIPKDFAVDDFDLCVIFFNALDNAIKGCAFANEKWIDIVAKKNKDFFIIDIMNSCAPRKYEKGLGIGLETMKFIAEKYGGYLEITTEEEMFRVSIMFSIK